MSAIRLTRAQRLRAEARTSARVNNMTTKRRPRKPPLQDHAARLVRILEANLATATDAELRARLQRAIEALREKWEAA
jgi:hypothetical protein